ncbi:MAG TPA: hypothetical protein VFV03_09530, partial [Solirubrobacteraceae bacterium]|nr:hypothetical protein [Solirubrobacteraceae bacterium]
GYPLQRGGESNAQSTAWAIQGLLAAGHDPRAITRRGHSPLGYLEGLIASDGSVRYSSASSQTPVWVTAEALAALAGKPLPIAPAGGPSVPPATPGAVRAAGRPPAKASSGQRISAPVRPTAPAKAMTGASATQTRLDALALEAGILVGVVLSPVLR